MSVTILLGHHSLLCSKSAGVPEPVDAGLVLDGVGLPVVADVLVLPDPVVLAVRLLLQDDAVLLLGRVAELLVAHVEALLLHDARQAGVAVVGRVGAREGLAARGGHQQGATELQEFK